MIVSSGEKVPAILEEAAKIILKLEGFEPVGIEASLLFAGQDDIRSLNARYRGKDEATDVLSFPMYASIEEIRDAVLSAEENAEAIPVLLGDIVICPEIAEKQAEELGQSHEREQTYLFVHGMLHLLGYDHGAEEMKRQMRAAEEKALGILMEGKKT